MPYKSISKGLRRVIDLSKNYSNSKKAKLKTFKKSKRKKIKFTTMKQITNKLIPAMAIIALFLMSCKKDALDFKAAAGTAYNFRTATPVVIKPGGFYIPPDSIKTK